MSGLDKIVSEILSEAKTEAARLVEDARAKAAGILEEYEAQSKKAALLIEQDAREKEKAILAATQSEIQHQQRQGTLAVKQELLEAALEHALESVYTMDEAAYFALLTQIAASNAQEGEGTLLLGKKDLARIPADFAAGLAKALPAGARLTLADTAAPIEGGCILRYGDTDKNCSFQAIFDARRDDFRDKAREILFA